MSSWSVIHQRGKNVVSASSGKTTNRAPLPCASRNSAVSRLTTIARLSARWIGPSWATAARSLRDTEILLIECAMPEGTVSRSHSGIARAPRAHPTLAELRHIAKHVVAGGHRPVFDPSDEIVEGGIALRVDEPAMADRAQHALDQQM